MRNFHASLLALSSSGGDLVMIPLLLSMSEDYHSKYSSSIFTEEIKITSKAETVNILVINILTFYLPL